jgi:hypothetical protein
MAVIGGVLQKIHFLAFDLPHSDGCFVAAYPAETTEAFCDGRRRPRPAPMQYPGHAMAPRRNLVPGMEGNSRQGVTR